ncbi:MAG: hypothetical protein ABIT96_10260 [Ferruginibacter sp.]
MKLCSIQLVCDLGETPEFKNAKTEESTSNGMSDERLLNIMLRNFSYLYC